MRNAIGIVAVAAICLALPELALANTTAQDQAAFAHWWSMGNAGPAPVQNIDGKDIPGAPYGMLVEMLEGHPQSARGVSTASAMHS
jgi:hypothetical protein